MGAVFGQVPGSPGRGQWTDHSHEAKSQVGHTNYHFNVDIELDLK